MDPVSIVEAVLTEETERYDRLRAAGDPLAGAAAWRIDYLENLLTTLVQFPLSPARFVELLKANAAIENPRFPGEPHASVEVLARWERRR